MQGVAGYVIRRLLLAPLILLFISVVTFSLGRWAPGDYIDIQAGPRATPETVERIKEARGLNDPVYDQYFRYLGNFVQGDLGTSVIYRGVDVEDVIFPRIWVTMQYNIVVLILTFSIGIPVGIWAALRRGTWMDPLSIGTFLLFASIPVVVSIPLLQWFFAVKLGWLPTGGWNVREFMGIEIGIFSREAVLPILILTLPGVAGLISAGPALRWEWKDYYLWFLLTPTRIDSFIWLGWETRLKEKPCRQRDFSGRKEWNAWLNTESAASRTR